VGRAAAPEGKDRDGPGPGGAAPEGKDAGEGDGGDAGEWREETRGRCDELEGMMKEGDLDASTEGQFALWFALGGEGDPHDAAAVKLALGMEGADVNAANDGGQTLLFAQCGRGRSRNVELLLADPRVDPNLAEKNGDTPLKVAAIMGRVRCVELLLSDPRVEVNPADSEGRSPLWGAASKGNDRCVELLLADPRVDPNQVGGSNGDTPLNIAANEGNDRCVELLLDDPRVDVSLARTDGQTPLVSACIQIMESMDRVGAAGGNDPARTLVIMLKSRRIPKHNVEDAITFMGRFMPTRRQIDAAEAGGEPLNAQQKTCRIVLPVLLAHLQGEFRWCAHCYLLTPDVDLHRCGGCKQVGYCEEAPPGQTKPCHKAHWKAGHKQECARFAAEAKAAAEAEEAEAEEAEAAAEAAAAAEAGAKGGGGGGGKKKRKGKKGKNRRR